MKLFALSYASFDCCDYVIYSDTLGIYQTEEDAIKAMQEYITRDIKEGDYEDDWSVDTLSAFYSDGNGDVYKCYDIKEFNM